MAIATRPNGVLRRSVVIGLIGFLTLVDLFATQAILPTLAMAYGVTPAAMGFAVNASTIGMAIAGLLVALVSRHINRRHGAWVCLVLLAIPTVLLAGMPEIGTFTALRIMQGVFMSSAFTLTMAYLAEQCSARDTAGALAAYITGVVASNLIGRLVSATVADHLGLAANFYVFALLNLAGAALVFVSLTQTTPLTAMPAGKRSIFESWTNHLRNGPLLAGFGIGFFILFAFIGTFTYVNFELTRPPLMLSPMALGLVYLVFLPAMFTTPMAGRVRQRFGTRPALWGALAAAGAGLPMLLVPSLPVVLLGLALIGAGTFFAQAVTTAFISRAAAADRGAASGIYLACYYLGGLAGSALLGQLFDRLGWTACVLGIAIALALIAALAFRLKLPAPAAAN
jgi:predicted MFS family arabinose efflux permease